MGRGSCWTSAPAPVAIEHLLGRAKPRWPTIIFPAARPRRAIGQWDPQKRPGPTVSCARRRAPSRAWRQDLRRSFGPGFRSGQNSAARRAGSIPGAVRYERRPSNASEIVLLTHWMGGVHTELRLPRRRRGQRNSISADMLAAVRQLVLIANDDLIAGILNRNGLVTGHGNRWTRERVSALRSHHKIPVFRPAPDRNKPWLNLNKAAGLLGIAPKTLRLAAEAGEIEAGHPLPDGPWIFSRSTLGEPAAQRLVRRARQNPNHPTGSHPDQQSLFSPMT